MRPVSAELQNIHAILELERDLRERRSAMERLIDHVSRFASGAAFIAIHVVWFVVWIVANSTGLLTFDRPPFTLLALGVSLEAIILAGFVLMARASNDAAGRSARALGAANQFARGAGTNGDAETPVSPRRAGWD